MKSRILETTYHGRCGVSIPFAQCKFFPFSWRKMLACAPKSYNLILEGHYHQALPLFWHSLQFWQCSQGFFNFHSLQFEWMGQVPFFSFHFWNVFRADLSCFHPSRQLQTDICHVSGHLAIGWLYTGNTCSARYLLVHQHGPGWGLARETTRGRVLLSTLKKFFFKFQEM